MTSFEMIKYHGKEYPSDDLQSIVMDLRSVGICFV